MVKIFIRFIIVEALCSSLLLMNSYAITVDQAAAQQAATQQQANASTIDAVNTVNQNTGVSKSTLTSGDVHAVTAEQVNAASGNIPAAQKASAEAQRQLDLANANLAEKKAILADAQAGLDRNLIQQKEAALAAAKSSGNTLAIEKATAELEAAKTPKYNPALIAQAQADVSAAQQTVVAAGHEAQYGLQTAAGADALRRAALEIDVSISDELTKDPSGKTKSGGILDLINRSTTATNLQAQYTSLSDYNTQLQQDIVMLILGQVTSRLVRCSNSPDTQLAIGAGQAFIVGEVAEYAQAEFLKGKLASAIANPKLSELQKQLDTFRTLRTEYQQVLISAKNKQKFRGLSTTAFKNAAALAAAEAVEDETWATSCKNSNINMTSRGQNQSSDNIAMLLALAAMYYSYPYCAGCYAAAAVLILKGQADSDKNSCSSGYAATEQKINDRKLACDALGTEDMITVTTTASKTITDKCLAESAAVSASAGTGCQGYSSSGAGPYSSCDKAADAYKRNMVSCPVSVLTAAKVSTLETSGVASEVGREFVRTASEKVSRTVDLRMASPRQRTIVWSAFAQLAAASVETNKQMIAVIQAQLDKIQNIITSLEAYSNGVILANVKSNVMDVTNPTIDANADLKLANTTACITGTGTAGPCKSVSSAISQSGSFGNFSSSLQEATSRVASGLDVINNTNSLSASNIAAVENASQSLGSINSSLVKKRKQLQMLSSNSNSNADHINQADQLIGNLKNTIAKEANKSGFAFKNLGGSNQAAVSSNSKATDSNTGKENDHTGELNASNGNLVKAVRVKPSAVDSEIEDKTKDKVAEDPENSEDGRRIAEAISARDKANKTKYSSNEELGLFEKITNAYIRNYDKVLKKKKSRDISSP